MVTTRALVRLLRPKEYIKNFFVLLPLFFGGGIADGERAAGALVAFAAFCLAASAVYVLNGILDRAEDRNHPVKCNRPIASGEVALGVAAPLGLLLAAGACLLAWRGGFFAPVAAYLALNVLYSAWAKHVSILDVSCVALGFVLRTVAGTEATHYALSPWLVMMVFLLSLFLVLGKRWDDLSLMERCPENGMVRRCAEQYSKQFLIAAITFLATANTVCYAMYAMSPEVRHRLGSEQVFLTLFWVVLGNLRYLQIILVKDASGSPTRVMLGDRFMKLTVLCWTLHMAALIYLR